MEIKDSAGVIGDLERFYAALNMIREHVGGERRLSEYNGRMGWPRRGVYFFFDLIRLHFIKANLAGITCSRIKYSIHLIMWK